MSKQVRRWLSSLLVLGLGACVSRVDPGSQPCPCAEGWTCCPSEDVCVRDGEACPGGSQTTRADQITVEGTVCTSEPEEVLFPVKVVLIVDSSGTMQFIDPSQKNTSYIYGGNAVTEQTSVAACQQTCLASGSDQSACDALCKAAPGPARQAAARALVTHFKDNPAVSFAIVRFNATVTVNGGFVPGSDDTAWPFTRDPVVLDKTLDSLTLADLTSDLDGALQTTRAVLEQDMVSTSAAERARTRYVVILLSDGLPGPQCKAGCDNDLIQLGSVPASGRGPSPSPTVKSWCDAPRDQWCDNFYISQAAQCAFITQWYPYLNPYVCPEYNTEKTVLEHVKEIVALRDKYVVGRVTFNTAFFTNPLLPKELRDLAGVELSSDKPCQKDPDCTGGEECVKDPSSGKTLCKGGGERLLIKMTALGSGTHHAFKGSGQLDFLEFDYASLFENLAMSSLIVTNENAKPRQGKLEPDSDGDGLIDVKENSLGLEPGDRDTDGDGLGDGLELLFGFDPALASKPGKPCLAGERLDSDGDGLNDCEERLLGSDPRVADTDRDRIPDGLEVHWGTNPVLIDVNDDPDFDGRLSGDEIADHTDPRVSDPKSDVWVGRYRYSIRQRSDTSTGNKCFDFSVAGIGLAPTRVPENRVTLWFGEAPPDIPQDYGNFKVACVRAGFSAGKDGPQPTSSKITLKPEDFLSPVRLRSDLKAGKDPCRGTPLP
jgi:hypothetical protein